MKSIFVALLITTLVGIPGSSFADSLRRSNYVEADVGAFVWGDPVINDIFGPFFSLSLAGNKSLNENFSVIGKFDHITGSASEDGATLTFTGEKVSACLEYFLSSNNLANPYLLGGVVYEKNTLKGTISGDSGKIDDSSGGIALGGGVEFDPNSQISLDIGLQYTKISDFDSISMNTSLGYAIRERITLVFNGAYAFDEQDYQLRAGVLYRLP